MADEAKQVELIKALIQRTRDGSLRWEQTTQSGNYMVAFPNRAIRISGTITTVREAYLLRIFDGLGNIQMEIRTNVGDVVAAPGDREVLRDLHQPLKELYQAARAVAAGGARDDAIIEDVLSEIRQLPRGGLKAG